MMIKQEFTFPSGDGIHTVVTAQWRPERLSREVMQLIHDISEHIGRYDSFTRFLVEHDFAVMDHDRLGHGHTARNPSEFGWFVDRDDQGHVVKNVRALRERAGAEYPGLPCFLLGHSMGSFVVRGYLMFWPSTVDGATLFGTGQEPPTTITAGRTLSALLIRLKGPRAHSLLLDALSVRRCNGQFKPVRTSTDWISRGTVVVDAYRADPLCRFLPTMDMYYDMMVGLQLLARSANLARTDPDTPVYFFAGGRGPVGTNGAGVRKAAGWFRGAEAKDPTIRLYPEGRHEMLNGANRNEVYRDVFSRLERRLPAQGPSPAGPSTRPLGSPPARSPPLPEWGA